MQPRPHQLYSKCLIANTSEAYQTIQVPLALPLFSHAQLQFVSTHGTDGVQTTPCCPPDGALQVQVPPATQIELANAAGGAISEAITGKAITEASPTRLAKVRRLMPLNAGFVGTFSLSKLFRDNRSSASQTRSSETFSPVFFVISRAISLISLSPLQCFQTSDDELLRQLA